MLVFFIIIAIVLILSSIKYFSKIKIEIDTLKLEKNEKLKINNFKIKLYLVLGKLEWFKLEISKEKLERSKNLRIKKLIEKISNLSFIKSLKGKELLKKRNTILEAVKDSKVQLERLNLKAKIGLSNIVLLSYIVAILNSLISIRLAKRAKTIDNKKYKYLIEPIKTNELYFYLSINCIISIKIANIINIILKKRGIKHERTSNRIFNGNSHEQYSRYGRRKYNNRRTYIYR